MAKEVKVDKYGYIPRYQNMSWAADVNMFNDLSNKMSAVHCKWYGSAAGLSSSMVAALQEAIKKGKTTFTAWKRNFEDEAYKGISGHTLTEERQRKKEQKIKEEKLYDSLYKKIFENCSLTPDELNLIKKLLKK